ncbi:hypothetical protein [Bradyrhizobium sp. Tv2a-2]|uniref:hypothetical protein n=1 Tax=Bradyrhizobium sp. Tv2a-2 TaxID=113395 RepID=UPI0004220BC3|nr:hypothetical protein [Bradyrhizobium sp. Tv2a-2]
MADCDLEWGGDFGVDATGDLLLVDGDDEVRQRLERRLFTAAKGGYVWHPEYGAGLPQKIGSVLSQSEIQSIVSSQIAMEASVAPNPPAQLTVDKQVGGTVTISIKYWDARTGESVSFSITA